jgi:predicted nuclease of predicted toxin-antitoxin system
MALKFYMDQNVPRAIAIGLRLREVDVITAYEDGAILLTDPELLDRAGELGRVLFTQDDDLLVEAAKRQKEAVFFRGVIYAHQLGVSIAACIRDLEMIARVGEPEDLFNRVEYLPL